MVRMAKTVIYPAAMRYQGELASACANNKAAGAACAASPVLKEVSDLLVSLTEKIAALEKILAHENGDTLGHAKFFCDKALPAMNELRAVADALESLVADDLWSLPCYQEMLFIR